MKTISVLTSLVGTLLMLSFSRAHPYDTPAGLPMVQPYVEPTSYLARSYNALEVDPTSMVRALQSVLFTTTEPSDHYYIRDSRLMLGILRDRRYNIERATRLAKTTIKHRKFLQLEFMSVENFICILYSTTFQTGVDVENRPVIWVRLGAITRFLKKQERAFRKPKNVKSVQAFTREFVQFSAFYINTWQRKNPEQKATLVIDFEETNEAMSDPILSSFIRDIDSIFPDTFELILHLRFKLISRLLSPVQNVMNYTNLKLNTLVLSSEEQATKTYSVTLRELQKYVPRFNYRTSKEQQPYYLQTGCEERHPPGSCRIKMNSLEHMFTKEFKTNCAI